MFSFVDRSEFKELKERTTIELAQLKKDIALKATDSEEAAKNSADNAAASLEKIKSTESATFNALQKLSEYVNQAATELQSLQTEKTEIINIKKTLSSKIEEISSLQAALSKSKLEIDKFISDIQSDSEAIKNALSEAENLPSAVEKTNSLAESAEETTGKLQDLLTHAMKRKSEIDDIHKQVFGSDVANDKGESEHIDGLIDDLESSYNKIKSNIEDLSKKIESTTSKTSEEYKYKLDEHSKNLSSFLKKSEDKISATNEKLAALLPGAMAAGLSAAYEKKKEDETTLLNKLEGTFRLSIIGLILISAIPFAIDAYLIIERGKDIIQIINETPKMIFSIFPIYFPVLWFAYSTNKKVNLSKKLIEEYTHKAVLGNTYSGLSNQIETLKNEEKVKEDLRTRLLFNVLQVSAENPGKLITNYNKADHPLMEALENSAKLSDSVVAISKIPGLSALAKKLTEKGEELFKEQQHKIEQGLSTQDTLESKEVAQKD